ncbi:hypothetical protein [Paraburkholderia sp.]|uniref:hypothetical protein n=1 Tax=Paraburkholderia sp. TaxID=1926495 RepID=UPI0025E27C31|nr:hypothetical protein [Paraburkholderia sp.]
MLIMPVPERDGRDGQASRSVENVRYSNCSFNWRTFSALSKPKRRVVKARLLPGSGLEAGWKPPKNESAAASAIGEGKLTARCTSPKET